MNRSNMYLIAKIMLGVLVVLEAIFAVSQKTSPGGDFFLPALLLLTYGATLLWDPAPSKNRNFLLAIPGVGLLLILWLSLK